MGSAELAKFPFDGYKLYVVLHKKMSRMMANLVHCETKKRTTISLARYLMSVHIGRLLAKTEQVDHINDDKLDDRIENLQILSQIDNLKKREAVKPKEYIRFKCPVCSNEFKRDRQHAYKAIKFGLIITCSRKCGGIKSHSRL